MEYSVPFSVLNERLRPPVSAMHQLCSSFNTLETRQPGSLRTSSPTIRPTVLPAEPKDPVTPADPEEPEDDAELEDLEESGPEEESNADPLPMISQCLIPALNLSDVPSEEQEELVPENNSPSETEEELTNAGPKGRSEPAALDAEGSRSYIDRTLPDLIRSGRPLGRRRTLGPVSDTLKEVRREVELSRRRSLKLKAQVDKLQESRNGPGWSQYRERVTEEVLSILRLLHPLTQPESSLVEPPADEKSLDAALSQLQSVARQLAIRHTKQEFESGAAKRNGEEDSAILQQALRDRDEALEKKKAMEAELLRSKTELMSLNNQLLEAVQKRLELSLELEAWREDFQLYLQQQIQIQQQAEQAQKKPSRLGLLKRNKPLVQRPSSFPAPAPTAPSVTRPSLSNAPTPRSELAAAPASAPRTPPTGSQRKWKDKWKRGRISRQEDQDAAQRDVNQSAWGKNDDGFQIISLD